MKSTGKYPCEKCRSRGHDRSGDNFHFYGEGLGGYCFVCGHVVPSDLWLSENGKQWIWEDEVATREKLTPEEVEKIKGYTGSDGKGMRGISDETYKAYGVRHKYSEETGEPVAAYYPVTEGYGASGFKAREYPKTFSVIGKCGKESDLYGQWKWKNTTSGKFVVLCAGEVDCMSAYQMLEDYRKGKGADFDPIPVVSSTIGENGSHKQLANHYEWLDRFDKVIVCYDQDDAGKKAVTELVKVIPKGKMYVMSLPMKDTNEMLSAGRAKQWIDCFWRARPYTPEGIVGSGALSEKIREYAAIKKIPLPPFMHRVQDLMAGGIPLGVILCLGSSSGSGKSTFTDEMLYYWIFNSPHKVGIISLESDSGAYATKLLSRHIGRKIDLIQNEEDKLAFLDSAEVLEKERDLFVDENGNDRFYLIEDRDSGWEYMKASIMNLIVSCDVKVVVLDPLQDAWAGMTLEQQEKAAAWLKGSVKSHGVTYILINHVRKSGGGAKANSQGADLTEEDFHGSSSIFKSSACNLLFMRNKEEEDEVARNTTVMKLSKCRWSGMTSPFAGKFYYDNATHSLHDFEDWSSKNNKGF